MQEKNNHRQLNGPGVTFDESNPSLLHKNILSKVHISKVKHITSQKVVPQTPMKKLEPAQDPQNQISYDMFLWSFQEQTQAHKNTNRSNYRIGSATK